MRQNCKTALARIPRDVLLVGVLLVASSLSFDLDYRAGADAPLASPEALAQVSVAAVAGSGSIVASKNGTKYYLTTCTGANRISPGNRVFFNSVSDAEAAGYTPAANCKGI
jgi:hypothetical protein